MRINVKQVDTDQKAKEELNASKLAFNEKIKIRSISQANKFKKVLEEKEKEKLVHEEKKAERLK